MPMTLAEKILSYKSNKSRVYPGEIVIVPVDCAMMTDILGPRIIAAEIERLGAEVKHPRKVVIVADHYTPSATEEQAEIVGFTRRWAEVNGIANYYESQGPCHQLLAEMGFNKPSDIVVGTDSHTCTSGAFGCFGTGIGSTEMLGVLIKGEIWFRVPESIYIRWDGALNPGIMAKDIILYTIGQLGHAGATYRSMEFCGSTIENLSMDERMCISNMAVEAGAKVGLMAADGNTVEYMERHGIRGLDPTLFFKADEDASYCQRLFLDASKLEPQIACPHQVDNVRGIKAVAGLQVDQVYIGSCTGGRITDLRMAANILAGQKVNSGCRLLISPASMTVWKQALREGIIERLVDAGGIVLPPTCGACLGLHSGTIGKGEVCVSTTNRNFLGRMGSRHGEIYLASAATAAATALEGRIAEPIRYLGGV